MHDTEPITEISDATATYYEDPDGEVSVRHEGDVEIYPGWVRLVDVTGLWVPREQVEQISEL